MISDANDKNTNATQDNEMDAFDMAAACLAGLRKAAAKAHKELAEVRAKNQAAGTPFANGVGSRVALIEAIDEAEKALVSNLGQVARATNRAMPKR